MKILLFGGAGQLGCELRQRALDLSFELVAPVRSEVDVAEVDAIAKVMRSVRPTLVINAAAYTAVDKAEVEREKAFRVNADGPRQIAECCKEHRSRLIHISTDYVFGEGHNRPIPETAAVAPPNVYGESKRAGEDAVLKILGDAGLVVRTSALHGKKGVNFVQAMLDLMVQRDHLRVVSDQVVSPTWAGWLAEVVLDLVRLDVSGILHASGAGEVSWFDFAVEILASAEDQIRARRGAQRGLPELQRVTAEEFGRPARRASYSVLDTSRLSAILGRSALPWRAGLVQHLKEIGFLSSAKESSL